MSNRIRPLQGEVLVYMDAAQSITDSGVLIPEQAQQRSDRGQVRALGIWRMDKRGRLISYSVKPGDRVIVSARRGRWMHSEKERLKIVDADDKKKAIIKKDKMKELLGRSPDYLDMLLMRMYFVIQPQRTIMTL